MAEDKFGCPMCGEMITTEDEVAEIKTANNMNWETHNECIKEEFH